MQTDCYLVQMVLYIFTVCFDPGLQRARYVLDPVYTI